MGEINRLLGESGAGHHFDALGKRWTLSPLTKTRQGEFEAWLEAEALAGADRLEASGRPEAAEKLRDRIDDKIASRHYTFGGRASRLALATTEGALEMLRILLKKSHPGLTPEQLMELLQSDDGEAAAAAVQRVVADFAASRKPKTDPPTAPVAPAAPPEQ